MVIHAICHQRKVKRFVRNTNIMSKQYYFEYHGIISHAGNRIHAGDTRDCRSEPASLGSCSFLVRGQTRGWDREARFSPEAVAFLEEPELKSNNTSERGSDETTLQRRLTQAAREEVYVVDAGVYLPTYGRGEVMDDGCDGRQTGHCQLSSRGTDIRLSDPADIFSNGTITMTRPETSIKADYNGATRTNSRHYSSHPHIMSTSHKFYA